MPGTLPTELREKVIELIERGVSDHEIARRTGVGRSTVFRWRHQGPPPAPGRRLNPPHDWSPPDSGEYAYALGIYLGDGYIGQAARAVNLVISLDAAYPGIVEECATALSGISGREIRRVRPKGEGCVRLECHWRHWPEVFPQHGPGRKHERRIELAGWQREVVDRHPERFLRGLIHSDGCRSENRFTVELKDGPREYAYPRYFFSNLSPEIRTLFCEYCDRLGIRWSLPNHRNVSVSHRESVARLDRFVGPKQ